MLKRKAVRASKKFEALIKEKIEVWNSGDVGYILLFKRFLKKSQETKRSQSIGTLILQWHTTNQFQAVLDFHESQNVFHVSSKDGLKWKKLNCFLKNNLKIFESIRVQIYTVWHVKNTFSFIGRWKISKRLIQLFKHFIHKWTFLETCGRLWGLFQLRSF